MKTVVKDYKYKIGDIVEYHPIIGEKSDGKTYEIIDLWRLGHGANVYKLKGKVGCVSEEAINLA